MHTNTKAFARVFVDEHSLGSGFYWFETSPGSFTYEQSWDEAFEVEGRSEPRGRSCVAWPYDFLREHVPAIHDVTDQFPPAGTEF